MINLIILINSSALYRKISNKLNGLWIESPIFKTNKLTIFSLKITLIILVSIKIFSYTFLKLIFLKKYQNIKIKIKSWNIFVKK